MGLFDIFKKNSGKGDGEKKKPSSIAKWAEYAGSKRAQAYDRQEAIQELSKQGTAEAVEALLKRFTFQIDPSITDQEEKEAAFEGILKAGREAIEPVRAFAMKAESINSPLRVMKSILEEEELVDELLVWLSRWDTEYAKFIDPKLQLLEELGERKHPKIREAVEPFLEDASDPARFNAVVAVLAQQDERSLEPILKLLLDEESTRIRAKIANGLAELGWEIPDDQRDPVRKVLPPEFGIDGEGKIKKR
ncbi:MAG: HEAT repeat domain-containing protein [Labilithrix sp.]|nr:HEAT repeat domain-containing protein [Labilithrix sp.]MCW5812957.1 HEAT repeat domain-containing protein [Labilithrix sp.]